MTEKKDNYYETITWIENVIESCETLEQENDARRIINKFEFQLLNDNNINPTQFQNIIYRINNKINEQYKSLINSY